jgi:hypothetical protein
MGFTSVIVARRGYDHINMEGEDRSNPSSVYLLKIKGRRNTMKIYLVTDGSANQIETLRKRGAKNLMLSFAELPKKKEKVSAMMSRLMNDECPDKGKETKKGNKNKRKSK